MIKEFDWGIFTGVGLAIIAWGLHQIFVIPRFSADHWAWLSTDSQVIEYFKFWFFNHGIWTLFNGLFVVVISATGYRDRQRWAWMTWLYLPVHILLLTTQFFWLFFVTIPVFVLLFWLLWVNRTKLHSLEHDAETWSWIVFLLFGLLLFFFAYDYLFVIPSLEVDHPERGWEWLTRDLEVLDYIKFYFRVFGIRVFGFGMFVLLTAVTGLRRGYYWAWWALLSVPALCCILALRWPWLAPALIGIILITMMALWISKPGKSRKTQERVSTMQWKNTVIINRPVEEVFAFVTDPKGGSQWHRANNITPLSEGPIRVGATFRVTGKFLWWDFDSVSEVSEYVENESIAYKSDAGMYTYHLRYVLEPIANGTKFTEIGEADPKGLLKFMIRLFMGGAKRNSEEGLRLLKEILEQENR